MSSWEVECEHWNMEHVLSFSSSRLAYTKLSELLRAETTKVSPGTTTTMKELYREIKINKHGLRFLPKLSLSGLAEVVYFYLLI